ncbi:MAG: tyrosine-type recombinase/integrase [Eubacteriales bacterium]|nr:tyrosine-type recombinase/integrase [Eubacteriales bacterium]
MPRKGLKQRADGRYYCRYKDKWFYGASSDEALDARDEYKRQLKSGLREEALGKTVTQYAKEWMPTYKADVSVKTYNDYAKYVNLLCAYFDGVRVRDVTATDIKRFYQSQSGKSKSYIRKMTMLTKDIFSTAVEDGVILRNPCAKVRGPAAEEGTHRALEQWERDLVVSMVGEHDMAIAAMLMLYGGLRRGEVIAFDISRDVDFKKGSIHVRNAVAFNTNQPTLKDPKTDAGERELYLFAPLRAALQGKSGLALKRKSGEIMSKSAWNKKWSSFKTAMETKLNGCHKRWYGRTKEHMAILAAGGELPPWRKITIQSHDFRHSFCTMLYDAGVDMKTAIKWMGHADETMILRIYAHLSEEKEKTASLAVGKLIETTLCSQNGSQPEGKNSDAIGTQGTQK